jgi:uncharacterized protein YdeI (YjbR/CyaY-like superfamily)
MEIRFFDSSFDFRQWLETNHDKAKELTLGFYKKGSREKGINYAEALDEALCYGWIDGMRKRLDAISYSIRFTPRKTKSVWSLVNLRHVDRLKKSGRMMPAGLERHLERDPARTGIYAFENVDHKLATEEERKFKANKKAWDYFQEQAPSYQRTAIWWIVKAKKVQTQARRLSLLMNESANGKRLAHLTPSNRSKTS